MQMFETCKKEIDFIIDNFTSCTAIEAKLTFTGKVQHLLQFESDYTKNNYAVNSFIFTLNKQSDHEHALYPWEFYASDNRLLI